MEYNRNIHNRLVIKWVYIVSRFPRISGTPCKLHRNLSLLPSSINNKATTTTTATTITITITTTIAYI